MTNPTVGSTVSVKFEDIRIQCTVLAVKPSYGRLRLLVSPVSGMGEQWVEITRLSVQ